MPEHKVLAAVVVLSIFAVGARAANVPLVIDDFSAPVIGVPTVINLLNPNPTFVKTSGASIFGGERDVLIDVKGTPVPISYAGVVGGGSFMFASFGSPGTVVTLQYDGLDADVVGPPAQLVNAEGLGGADLTVYGSAFYMDFLFADGGDATEIDIQIRVNSTTQSSTFSGAVPESPSPLTFLAPFNSFSDPSVFQNATSIEVILNSSGTPNVDFELGSFGVPEPGTILLLGLGGLGVLRNRRSR